MSPQVCSGECTHTHPYIWDFKQRVRKGLVRRPEVIFFATRQRLIIREFNIQLYHDGFSGGNDAYNCIRVLLLFIAIISKCWRTPLTLKSCSDPPWQGNVKKIIFIKKCVEWANSGLACVHTTWWDDIPYKISSFPWTVFCVFGSTFYSGVVLDTEFWAHARKISLQKFPRMTKKGWNIHILRFFSNIPWRSKHLKYN